MAVNKRRYMYYNGTGYDEEHFVTDANITYMNDGTTVEDKLKMYTTTNSSNAYSVTIPNLASLTDGLNIRVKFNVASTGAITLNINSLGAKSVKDFFGNSVTNVRANLPANLTYESISDSFILLGKGGGGNAVATDLLSGKTATTDNGQITGNMPNNPAQVNAVSVGSSGTNKYFRIPTGAYLTKASQGYPEIIASATQIDSNIVSANIKKNVSICGVAGGIDLSNLKPENVKKDVNINGTIGTLEEKLSSINYLKNLTGNYIPIKFIEGEGLYCYCSNYPSDNKCYLFNENGVLIKTISVNGENYYIPYDVNTDKIIWVNQNTNNTAITDKNGTVINYIATSGSSTIYNIFSYDNTKIYSYDNSYGSVNIYNLTGTLLKSFGLGNALTILGFFSLKNNQIIIQRLNEGTGNIQIYFIDENAESPVLIGRNGGLVFKSQIFNL
ncbi:MAG: hypothetical protein LIR50_03010 [Bacillota bacterium]|nr:hypothetical protein [Bacillota bacterium]